MTNSEKIIGEMARKISLIPSNNEDNDISEIIARLKPLEGLIQLCALRSDCLNKPMRDGCKCYGCKTRELLADLGRGTEGDL